MPVLTPRAFGAEAKLVTILPPGTSGAPYKPGVDLRATVLPQEADADGTPLPDQFVVVAHVPSIGFIGGRVFPRANARSQEKRGRLRATPPRSHAATSLQHDSRDDTKRF